MDRSSPPNNLSGANILLGITGSIAAYKGAELLRFYTKAGAEVQVVHTPSAEQFISPLTLAILSERPVYSDLFSSESTEDWTKHVTLGQWADIAVIAPATANTIAELAHGTCTNMLTATLLSAQCPVLVCPAMDRDMYRHPATQRNLDTIGSFGYHVLPAEYGPLASGLEGQGRLPEPTTIVEQTSTLLGEGKQHRKSGVLSGKKVVVTAGPTREPIDPVRFISNWSTGAMGFALAQAAQERGADVTLITGPTTLDTPPGVQRVDIVTTEEMKEAVFEHAQADLIIMSAAVADYKPADAASQKLKKDGNELSLRLSQTPDILAELGAQKPSGQTLVGFALETHNELSHAREKLEKKNLDWIVLNNPMRAGEGFGPDTNRVTLLGTDGAQKEFPLQSKQDIASKILEYIIPSLPTPASEPETDA